MATLDVLYYNKRKYEDLKRKLEDMIVYLNKSINYMSDVNNLCSGSFKINNESAAKNEIRDLNLRLISVRDTLNDKVYLRVLYELRKIRADISNQENI